MLVLARIYPKKKRREANRRHVRILVVRSHRTAHGQSIIHTQDFARVALGQGTSGTADFWPCALVSLAAAGLGMELALGRCFEGGNRRNSGQHRVKELDSLGSRSERLG